MRRLNMKICKNILFRYESNIRGGKLFIFDLNNYKVYEGNYLEYIILKYIKQNMNIYDIIDEIAEKHQIDNLENKIYQFTTSLQELGVITL